MYFGSVFHQSAAFLNNTLSLIGIGPMLSTSKKINHPDSCKYSQDILYHL